MKRQLVCLIVALALVSGLAPVSALAQSIVPSEVNVELAPGESVTLEKQVTTPEIPPTPDIYFLSDTTGSMGPSIAAVQADATSIIADILALDPDAQFGVGDYKDFPFDPWAFLHQQSLTDDTAAVASAIGDWGASGGSDIPEGQFYALYRMATDPAIGWRTDKSRIVVWFGDAPGHDPIPTAATGLGFDITEAVVTNALVAAGIRVIAVSVTSGMPDGLDDDPLVDGGDYTDEWGIVENGLPGQATRIAAATGGSALFDVEPEDVTDAILAGIADISTDVWATAETDPGLSVTFAPVVREDTAAGTTVTFQETISVDADVEEGTVLSATVTFWANSYPEQGASIGQQTITVVVSEAVAAPAPTAVPGLPTTGLGPDRGSSLPWQAFVIAGLVFGLAYTTLRENAISQE